MDPESNAANAISVQNLYKIFGSDTDKSMQMVSDGADKEEVLETTGDTVAVNNANLDIRPQETFIVMGLSGSGKSTLVRCAIRLIDPTHGSVQINGNEVTQMDEEELRQLRRKEIGMVFQQFALFPHRKVIDNVAYGMEIQGIPRGERYETAEEVLDMVGLQGWEDYHPSSLSGGMQQRVGLARALAHDPNILLMDEPFSALDPLIRRDMQRELLELQEQMNKTILFITHNLDEALQLGDRIAIMNEGEVVQIGEPKEIVTEPADDYVADFVRDVNRHKILTAGDVTTSDIPVFSADARITDAWEEISESDAYCIIVADEDHRLRGMAYSHDVRAHLENRDARLEKVPLHEVETAQRGLSVEDLLPKLSADSHPVVLTDQDQIIDGVVDASSLVAGLSSKSVPSTEDEQIEITGG